MRAALALPVLLTAGCSLMGYGEFDTPSLEGNGACAEVNAYYDLDPATDCHVYQRVEGGVGCALAMADWDGDGAYSARCLDELGAAIFSVLGKVRVYLKPRGSQPDYDQPLVLDRGGMVEDAALSVHKDWTVKVKYALLWGSGKFGSQRVGREFPNEVPRGSWTQITSRKIGPFAALRLIP